MTSAQSGVEELRKVAAQLDMEGDLHVFSAEQIVRICRAVRASGWDVYPAQLPLPFLRHAARTGRLSATALAWMERRFA